ncbi:hypothetical protein BB934_31510 (plasmid) [Microvirga ossetica]|uniref:DUF4440 domain-containing protein n=1 Tax=Microvirga ossetica TaxID=1882682 RepID=A0A1B2ESH1_9HYPH|nr:SgcJ/EcaC family oxidoreductase [Microvirga ossetica]ANY82772.1 hypothetical protein BB934_31510 [Microvirga ossetica]
MTRSVVVEPEIQAISDKFIAAFKKGDAQGITDLFAKDAVLLPNHAPRLKGQQAIAAHWKAGLEQLSTIKLTTTDVIPLGSDTVARIGTWKVTTKDEQPMTFSGKDLVLYRKEGGDWKIVADIWNTDQE